MKNLYLAILLLAFAANLSAFDKVWELQFSSTPHHVHYTEGHKELIVGEGNTFKKYNAETGALIDSVVFSLPDSTQEFFVTDDLKYMYVFIETYNKYLYNKITISNGLSKNIFARDAGGKGKIYQVSNSFIVLNYFNGRDSYTNTVGGDRYIINNDSIYSLNKNNYLKEHKTNSFNNSFVNFVGSVYIEQKGGYATESTHYNYYNLKDKNYIVLDKFSSFPTASTNDKFMYYISSSNSILIKQTLDNKSKFELTLYEIPTNILASNKDNEIFLIFDNKIAHLNFDFNDELDMIEFDTKGKSFFSNYSNNLLMSIDSSLNSISAYKSKNTQHPKVKFDKNSILQYVDNKSTVTLQMNMNPISREWDLGDGRRYFTGDSVELTYPKSGIYTLRYKAIYQDTTIDISLNVEILDSMKIEFTNSIDKQKDYTYLTIIYRLLGSCENKYFELSSYNSGKVQVSDSGNNYVRYKLSKNGIYSFKMTTSNRIDSVSKSETYLIPIESENIDYMITNNSFNIVVNKYTDKLYFYDYNTWIDNIKHFSSGGQNITTHDFNIRFTFYTFDDFNMIKYLKTSTSKENKEVNMNPQSRIFIYNSLFQSTLPLFSVSSDFAQTNYIINENDSIIKINGAVGFRTSLVDMVKHKDNYILFCKPIDNNNNKSALTFNLLDKNLKGLPFSAAQYFLPETKLYSDGIKLKMISLNSNITIHNLDDTLKILDTLFSVRNNKYVLSKSIGKNYAFALLDTVNAMQAKALQIFNLNKKTTKTVDVDSSISFYQVYQLSDSITSLVGWDKKQIIIRSFNNYNTAESRDFKFNSDAPFQIVETALNNELYLRTFSNNTLLKTKGFATIIDSLSSVAPFDDKDKTFIVANDNNYGNVQQSSDYSSAMVIFKDSLDLSNSFIKIYTETGDEILTYDLNKDQKELPIQTDKLYHGTYFVRLYNKGEEHNLGKFLIVR